MRCVVALMVPAMLLAFAGCKAGPPAETEAPVPGPETVADGPDAGGDTDPANPADEYLSSGKASFEAGDYDGAIDQFTRAVELDPAMAEAYARRGIATHWRSGEETDLMKAMQDLDTAVEMDGELVDAHIGRGHAYLDKGMRSDDTTMIDEAIAAFQRAGELDESNSAAHAGVGDCLYAKQEYRQAIEAYTRSIDLDPANAEAYSGRSVAYQAVGRDDLAEEDYKKAEELGYGPGT